MVSFVAEHDEAARLVDRIGMQVTAIFAEAEARVVEQIARRVLRELPENPSLALQARVLAELERFARQAVAGIGPDLAEEVVASAVREGTTAMAQQFASTPSVARVTGISASTAAAAVLIASDLGNAFADMRARILRYPRDAMGQFVVGGDVYQQVIANNASLAVLGAGFTHDARKAALREFLERGVTGFTDVAGRNWRIGTYTEMATRTAVSRAFREGGVGRASAAGVEYFTVLGGRNSCKHCAEWFGKVLAATGDAGTRIVRHATEDRFITIRVVGSLADWRASGAGHPNCTCVLAAYLPGLTEAVAQGMHDPVKDAARDHMRFLEREVRAAKRKRDIAEAAGDGPVLETAKARIRDLQAKLREHAAATDQRRRLEREQPRFSDG
ncbi:phage minor capsid protein [Pseudoclavibacter helvolus]|uniref:phage minor capsid protein n=1 Tax=Pseudoclavibacter helvolus TaxID=255205 RepID=UPI0035F0EFBE